MFFLKGIFIRMILICLLCVCLKYGSNIFYMKSILNFMFYGGIN